MGKILVVVVSFTFVSHQGIWIMQKSCSSTWLLYRKTNETRNLDKNRRFWLLMTLLCQDALVARNKDSAATQCFAVLTDAEHFLLFAFLPCISFKHQVQLNQKPPWNLSYSSCENNKFNKYALECKEVLSCIHSRGFLWCLVSSWTPMLASYPTCRSEQGTSVPHSKTQQ